MRSAIAALLVVVGVSLGAGPAGAAPPCGAAVTAARQAVAGDGGTAQSRARLIELAATSDPRCAGAILALDRLAAENANPILRARGFLGPIGWFWNNIYFRVFSGSTPNMVLFGIPLFFSPLVLVGSFVAVLSGTKGARKRPYVPVEIRTQVN